MGSGLLPVLVGAGPGAMQVSKAVSLEFPENKPLRRLAYKGKVKHLKSE